MAKKSPKKAATDEKPSLEVSKHVLVAKHDICTEEEKNGLLARYKTAPNQMPRINARDPAIRHLACKVGDLIKITRQSETAGVAIFYRIVSSE